MNKIDKAIQDIKQEIAWKFEAVDRLHTLCDWSYEDCLDYVYQTYRPFYAEGLTPQEYVETEISYWQSMVIR